MSSFIQLLLSCVTLSLESSKYSTLRRTNNKKAKKWQRLLLLPKKCLGLCADCHRQTNSYVTIYFYFIRPGSVFT